MKSNSVFPKLKPWLAAAVAAVATILMMLLTHFYKGPGKWYTEWNPYKWQVEAFLRGRLAILEEPFANWTNSVWGRGLQQQWGLGVPLLTLPFEILSKAAGIKAGFPDRIHYLIFYFFTAALFWRALDFVGENMPKTRKTILRIFAFTFAMLPPQMLAIVNLQFYPYEKAILYGNLFTIIALSLAILCLSKPSKIKFAGTAFVCGFLPLIRSVFLLHGLFIAAGLAFAGRKFLDKKLLAVCAVLTAIGPATVLVTNQIRYGAPLEFGFHLDIDDSVMRFDMASFASAPPARAALETALYLFGFTVSDDELRYIGHADWEVPIRRNRQLVGLYIFFPWDALIVFIGFLAPFVLLRGKVETAADGRIIRCLWIFAVLTFGGLFYTYMKSASVSSRYMADFTMPIAVAQTLCFALVSGAFEKQKVSFRFAGASLLACGLFILGTHLSIFYDLVDLTDADNYNWNFVGEAKSFSRVNHVVLPEQYACRDMFDPVTGKGTRSFRYYGILENTMGWEFTEDCTTQNTTTVFFRNLQCAELNFTAPAIDPSKIIAKSNLEFMTLKSHTANGDSHTAVFCREPATAAKDVNTYHMFSVKWTDTLDEETKPGIVLQSIKKTSF